MQDLHLWAGALVQWFGPGKWLERGQVWSVDVRTVLVRLPVSVTWEGTAVPEPRVSSVTRNPVTGGAGGGTSVTRDVLDHTTPDQNKPGELTSSLKPKGVNQTAGRGAGAQIKGLSSEPTSSPGLLGSHRGSGCSSWKDANSTSWGPAQILHPRMQYCCFPTAVIGKCCSSQTGFSLTLPSAVA